MSTRVHAHRYDAWVIAQDAASNSQATPVIVQFTTIADQTPPFFQAGYPRVASVSDYTFDVEAQLDEGGAVSVVVVATGAAAPTPQEVLAGTGSGGSTPLFAALVAVPEGSTTVAVSITSGVIPSTPYDVHVLALDAQPEPNSQTAVTLLQLSTAPDSRPPIFVGTTPRVANIAVSGAALRCCLWWGCCVCLLGLAAQSCGVPPLPSPSLTASGPTSCVLHRNGCTLAPTTGVG